MKISHALVSFLILVMMFLGQVEVSRAVNCTPTELLSCYPAIISQQNPSSQCCQKLKEQRPCLCGYLKDPNLRTYVNSPGSKRVAAYCGVPFPSC